ncbi:fibrobacter succinogenes major paralogous domain-containing protein [Fibrobacter sp. UWEL]|uniref:fibrobacter succinogenes major paralogous domain-containing protein n=1 Tax=Fibrobacter sp. UWEL TaxID=1896209 RepID=UPI00091EE983|nr:fibrobacter succinogenes major paralogous domain-containing protein [Fibrobacter sp. UWEL]SHL08406.1 major paralogous domain-containing protein [Fibrobacter sp. UWEL]
MRIIYKISVLTCTLVLSAGFVACGGDSGTSAKDDESSISSSSIATNSSSSRNDGAESSSSVVESSSSSVIPSSSSEESSSSVASSSSEVVQLIPYTTECPAGHVCTYAPTEQLNPKITYGELLDTRDYQVYKTVEICDSDNANCQTWMAQNLNYADSIKTTSLKERSWCYKGYVDSCVKYGRFYTWAAAIDSVALADDVDNPQTCGFGVECDRLTADALAEKSIQGICPNDWHLPSYAELNTLLSAVGGEDVAGRALKSVSGWYNNGNGIDTYGFSALPVGYKEGRGSFDGVGKFSRFWSATETDVRGAYLIYLYYYAKYVNPNDSFKNNGYSVRCIKD